MAAGMPRTSFATRVSLETIDRDAFTHHAGQARSSQGRGHPQIIYKGGKSRQGETMSKHSARGFAQRWYGGVYQHQGEWIFRQHQGEGRPGEPE